MKLTRRNFGKAALAGATAVAAGNGFVYAGGKLANGPSAKVKTGFSRRELYLPIQLQISPVLPLEHDKKLTLYDSQGGALNGVDLTTTEGVAQLAEHLRTYFLETATALIQHRGGLERAVRESLKSAGLV